MTTRRTVLVTGATGFLGGAVSRRLARLGWEVRATGRNEAAGRALAREEVRFRRAALEHPEEVRGLCDDQHAVVHCAARSSPWGTQEEFETANVQATANLLRAARTARVRRFVHVSTPSVYFDFRHRLALTEESPLASRPANLYVATKLTAERLVLRAAEGMPVIILRPRAIFGPGDTTIFPRLLRAARRGRLPTVGDGRNIVDLTFIDNAVEAVTCALDAPPACHGHVFNVTDGQPVVLWEFIRSLLEPLGLSTPRHRLPLAAARALGTLCETWGRLTGWEPEVTAYSLGVLGYSQTFDLSKARTLLGYHPTIPTDEGARRLVEALRRSPAPAA